MAPTRPPHGELTWASVLVGILVAAIMGASYPYMVLKLGFGPNVSVVAAFFGFVLLNLINRKGYDRWQNNIVQTAGTSASQTAFMCVLLGGFDILRANTAVGFHLELTPFTTFLWLSAACTLGVLLAVPLRRHFIVDEKLPFADGVAAAETMIVLDPPKGASPELLQAAKQAAKAMFAGVALSGFLMLIREDAMIFDWLKEGWAPATVIGTVALAHMSVGVSYSLLSIGSGMLVGLRVNASMMLGGVMAWIIAPYLLVKYGILHEAPKKTEVLFWVMWPATGMLVAGGLTALALRWRLLVDTFRSLRHATIGSEEFPMKWLVSGIIVSAVALCVIQRLMLDMPIWMTVAAIVLSVPLMLVGLRVLGETNWGPISALSNMMQGLFAAVAPGNIAANMVASGTTGTVATSSEAIMQDFRAGEILGSTPRAMTLMQLIGVPVGAAAVAVVYPALVKTYGIVGDNAKLASPISQKWAGFAAILKQGVGALPSSAIYALLIFSVLGIVLTVLESRPSLKRWVPSPTGVGIGILVPFSVISTMFLGGVVGTIWERVGKKSADQYMIPLASGFIAGEAIIAVIVPLLLWMGLGH